MFWRHVVAATEEKEAAGNSEYQGSHMNALFQEGFSFSGFERDLLALNLGSGRYVDISGVSGVDSISDGRGAAFADFDNDGDLDIFLTAMQREAHYLFRNNVGERNGFLRVELEGDRGGRDAFGAVVRVKTSAGILTKVKAGGSGYLSQWDPRLTFGLGAASHAEWVEVTWPGGARQRWERVPAGTTLRAREGKEGYDIVAERRFRLPDPASPEDIRMAKLRFRRGDRFPDLDLRTLEGESVQLKDLIRPGNGAYINLWATHCIPCAKEMPALQEMIPRFREAGVQLLGVSLDVDTISRIPRFLEKYGIEYPIVTIGEDAIPRIFSGEEVIIPLSFLLDEQGHVVEVLEGWSEGSREELLRLLEEETTVAGGE